MKIKYSSNNSGGSWWLKDEDWFALEKAGWNVEWKKNEKNTFFKPDAEGRWMGALATEASVERATMKEAIEEFERITGQDASAEGCNCCGAPHSFSSDGEYASGEDVVAVLYGDDSPKNLREAVKQLKSKA